MRTPYERHAFRALMILRALSSLRCHGADVCHERHAVLIRRCVTFRAECHAFSVMMLRAIARAKRV